MFVDFYNFLCRKLKQTRQVMSSKQILLNFYSAPNLMNEQITVIYKIAYQGQADWINYPFVMWEDIYRSIVLSLSDETISLYIDVKNL